MIDFLCLLFDALDLAVFEVDANLDFEGEAAKARLLTK
jgi:hypothetical protein